MKSTSLSHISHLPIHLSERGAQGRPLAKVKWDEVVPGHPPPLSVPFSLLSGSPTHSTQGSGQPFIPPGGVPTHSPLSFFFLSLQIWFEKVGDAREGGVWEKQGSRSADHAGDLVNVLQAHKPDEQVTDHSSCHPPGPLWQTFEEAAHLLFATTLQSEDPVPVLGRSGDILGCHSPEVNRCLLWAACPLHH